jgi:hypothetical protein
MSGLPLLVLPTAQAFRPEVATIPIGGVPDQLAGDVGVALGLAQLGVAEYLARSCLTNGSGMATTSFAVPRPGLTPSRRAKCQPPPARCGHSVASAT